MRVTDKMGFDQSVRNLQKNRSEMSELQNQAATQKRLTKPSDDPVAAARILGTRTEDRGFQQFQKNINVARSFLEYSDQALGEMSEILMRTKELALQQASDAASGPETRRIAAEEVGQAFSQSVQIGNRKLGERYIFGGYQTMQQPFDLKGNYYGDDGDMNVVINKDASIAMNIPGGQVFLGRGISADGLLRARIEPPLTRPTLEEFQQKEIDRSQEIERGQEQEVQLRSLASVNKPQAVGARSVSSSESQGVNVLGVLKDLEISLRTNDKTEIQDSIDQLDLALSQVVHGRAQVGARIQNLNSTQDSIQKSLVENKALASQLEDVELYQLVSDINKNESTLKATLETSGRMIQHSLLDFLK
jgi:flagellar hook-associated protein 3 FlgL